MTIKIYPSLMEGAPIETHEWAGTIGGWMQYKGIDYHAFDEQPVVVMINGVGIDVSQWGDTHVRDSDDVQIRPLPRGGALLIGAVAAIAAIATMVLMPKPRSSSRHDPGQGRALESASAKANEAKLGQVVPELAGRFIRYPDYLTPPRRRFLSPREQVVEFLACVGPGQYQILPHDIKIGDTRIGSLGEGASYQIFEPGQSVAGHSAHEHWHTVAEVGSTSSGTAGLELPSEPATAVNTDPPSYTFNGLSITRSSGSFPSGWGQGTIVSIKYPRQYVATNTTLTGFFGHSGTSVGSFFDDSWNTEVISNQGDGYYTLAFWRMETREGSGDQPDYEVKVYLQFNPGTHTYDFAPTARWTIESRQDGSITLLNEGRFFESDVTLSTSIKFEDGTVYGEWTSTIAACPPGESTSLIELDFFFPSGLNRIEDDGTVVNRSVRTEIQWRDSEVGGAFTSIMRTYTERTLNQVGYTWQISVPGIRPEVRIRRVGVQSTSTQVNDTIQWFGLKSRLPTRTSYPDWMTIAIRMRSGGRLGSNAENRVNLVATRILPTVNADGTIGPAQPTRNVADFVRHIVDSIGRGDDAINMQELARLSTNVWQPRGEHFDYVFDETNVKEAIDTALRAGMSEFSLENGKIRPVRDDVRTVWEQGYSPQNMVKPLRRSADPHKHDDHDGVEVEYIDSNGWVESVVQCRLPGDAGLRVEKVKLDGVTDRTRAWRIGMRH